MLSIITGTPANYLRGLDLIMLRLCMFDQLIFSVVPDSTEVAAIRLLVCVSSLVIVAIADCCEPFGTVRAGIRLFPCVDSDMNKKVSPLIKLFFAVRAFIVVSRV